MGLSRPFGRNSSLLESRWMGDATIPEVSTFVFMPNGPVCAAKKEAVTTSFFHFSTPFCLLTQILSSPFWSNHFHFIWLLVLTHTGSLHNDYFLLTDQMDALLKGCLSDFLKSASVICIFKTKCPFKHNNRKNFWKEPTNMFGQKSNHYFTHCSISFKTSLSEFFYFNKLTNSIISDF